MNARSSHRESQAAGYPTAWQRKTMWASLSAVFVVILVTIVLSVVWLAANVVAFLQPILIPVAIAAILAYLLNPVVERMSQHRIGRTSAVLLLFLIAFLSIAAMVAWVAPSISVQSANFAHELPNYTTKARDRVVDIIYRYDRSLGVTKNPKSKDAATSGLLNWLLGSPTPTPSAAPLPRASAVPNPEIGPPLPPDWETTAPMTTAERQRIQNWVQQQLPNLERQVPYLTEKAWDLVKRSIGGFLGVTGFLISLVMVPIYLFFLLKESPAIERRWREYLPLRPSPLRDEVAAVLSQINNYVIAYFRGQLLVCLVDGLLIGIALTVCGLNFAPLVGLLVVVLTMIPYVGIILCWIPAVLIAFAQTGDWHFPLGVTAIFFIVQQAEGTFYAPRIVGKSVGLHPMTVIVSIFIWGLLIGGLLGPILAIPLTATVKVLLARYVWGRRLREKVAENVEEVPVVREPELVVDA